MSKNLRSSDFVDSLIRDDGSRENQYKKALAHPISLGTRPHRCMLKGHFDSLNS